MSGSQVQQKFLLATVRNFHRSAIFCEKKAAESLSTESQGVDKQKRVKLPGSGSSGRLGDDLYKVKPLDKYLLVWNKNYKSTKDVPSHISETIMDHVHSKSRIRIANRIMILGLIGCIIAIFSGKKASSEGDSIQKRILDQHKLAKEEYLNDLQKQSKSD